MQNIACFLQFLIGTTIGCWVYYELSYLPDSKGPLIAALFCGFMGNWLIMVAYNWIRHGWGAAKSVSWF